MTPSSDAPTEPSKEAHEAGKKLIGALVIMHGMGIHAGRLREAENEAAHALDRFRAAGVREDRRALSALLHWLENDPTSIGALAAANHARNVLKGETP